MTLFKDGLMLAGGKVVNDYHYLVFASPEIVNSKKQSFLSDILKNIEWDYENMPFGVRSHWEYFITRKKVNNGNTSN